MTTTVQPTLLSRGVDLPLTPEQVFENLYRLPGFVFLDSGSAEHPLARYSYVGVNPFLTLKSRGEGLDVVEGKSIRHMGGNPLTVLQAQLHARRLTAGSQLIPFAGGAVGYLSYELGRFATGRPCNRTDDLQLPEMVMHFYKTVLAYDHGAKRWYGSSMDLTGGRGTTIRKRLGNEIDKLCEFVQKQARQAAALAAITPVGDEASEGEARFQEIDGLRVESTLSREEYLQAVRDVQRHIAAGDIYQANLTQRWTVPFSGDPGALYMALRRFSPAPFGIYLNAGECIIAGSSPESFLSVDGRTVETRPIKGTRPRGASPEEDERMKRELLESAKDRAELTMIADLERNDLGRICTPGSVEVADLHRLETFSNVHHLVSVIKGELHAGIGTEEILKATFPGGSITGAPKLRAMEILDEAERTVRGPYTGAMGYLGFDGGICLNVAIRTLVVAQGKCHLGVGSGIVADSQPEAEYAECVAKARDMVRAIRETSSPQEPEAGSPAEAPLSDPAPAEGSAGASTETVYGEAAASTAESAPEASNGDDPAHLG